MRANGEQINKNPRILMSTIHGAKGGEADKVLLMQDLTNAALETFSHDPDELHRLFYTGATRAKRELHVLDPKILIVLIYYEVIMKTNWWKTLLQKYVIQPSKFVIENNRLLYPEGCAIKYIIRHQDKNGKEDLLKAIHFIEMIIERDYK